MDSVTGQITYRRPVSKKLVFFDLQCALSKADSSSDVQACVSSNWIEVVVKLGQCGSTIQDIKDLRDTLKLGDVIQVTGTFESDHVIQAVAVTVLQPWRQQNPDKAFTPQPAPVQDTPQQQQQQDSAMPRLSSTACQVVPKAVGAEQVPPAAVHQPQLPVCKFWVNTGRRGQQQQLSSDLGFSHERESAAAKGKRAQLFAAWLVDTFGRDKLNAGDGVLDTAGGAGGMTYELCVVHGIKCTLVDPRPLKLNKQQHRQLEAAGKAAVVNTWTAGQLQAGGVQANQLPIRTQQMHRQRALAEQQLPGLERDTEVAVQQEHPQPSLCDDIVQFKQVQGWFGPELWRSSGFQALFGGCSLVLGLHPDEATEPIVDFALEAGLSYAVMPCCVFPRLFTERRIERDGERVHVTSYADLIEYLTLKGHGKQEVLNFVGANVVVYKQV